MNIPSNLKYTREHEWVKLDGEVVTIGITDYAQGELGDVVFIELPSEGSATDKMKPCGSIEAVKTVSDVFSPVTGEVIEVNSKLETNPQAVNQDPYGEGWMLKIKLVNAGELEDLLSANAYREMIEAE
ncbi:glycine cleavage system protein GcvH [bacterium]|nr:glycine cleavage system protein GcvH [bacterium]